MLNHIMLLQFNRHVTDGEIDQLEKELDELPNSVVEIQMYEFGRNVVQTDRAYDFAVVALFANKEALQRCLQQPAQRRVLEKIDEICQQVITVDFFGSDAGSLRDKPSGHLLLEEDFPQR